MATRTGHRIWGRIAWAIAGALLLVGPAAHAAIDESPPWVELTHPVPGDWVVRGGTLLAEYLCADDTGVARCDGPVPSGTPVDTSTVGWHDFVVVAEDDFGQTATAVGGYAVFEWVTAPPPTARPGAGLVVSLGMGLAPKTPSPVSSALAQLVDCATGDVLGAPEPAAYRERVSHKGGLELRWLTSRAWSGQCWTLSLVLAAPGWQPTPVTFGPVSFT